MFPRLICVNSTALPGGNVVYWPMVRKPPAASPDFTTRVVVTYAVAAALYILLSDSVMHAIWPDHEDSYRIGIWKGWGFVAVTSLVLWWILRLKDRALARVLAELESAGARWRYALEGAGHGVWEWDATTGRVFFSTQWKSMLGYAEDEIGDSYSEWESRVHPDDLGAVRKALDRHFSGADAVYRSEHRLRCRDGGYKWILDQGKVMSRTADGRPHRIIGTHTDMTERRQADDMLRALSDRLAFYQRASPVIDYAMSLEGGAWRPVWVSENVERLLGYTVAEALRPGWWEAGVDAADLPEVRRAINAALAGSGSLRLDYRFRRKDGSMLWVQDELRVVRGEHGGAEVVGAWSDVSERKALENALRESESRFRAVAEQTLVGIYVLDGERFTYINPRAAAIFGYQPAEAREITLRDVLDPDELASVSDRARRRLAGEVIESNYEVRARRCDGTPIVIGLGGTAAEIGGRRVILGALQDITDKHRAEETIRDYVNRLESAILGTAAAVSQMVELRDPYTAGHERRVGELSAAIAAEMGLDENTQRGLRVAGAVHDVGKIMVPAEILSKPSRLTAVEFELVKQHAQQGYEVLKDVAFPWPVAEVARQHHERLDGSGYPRGLKGESIVPEARILAVADVVESMSSHRPYRPGLGLERALEEVEMNAGRLYDPAAVAACLRLFRDKGYRIPD